MLPSRTVLSFGNSISWFDPALATGVLKSFLQPSQEYSTLLQESNTITNKKNTKAEALIISFTIKGFNWGDVG